MPVCFGERENKAKKPTEMSDVVRHTLLQLSSS